MLALLIFVGGMTAWVSSIMLSVMIGAFALDRYRNNRTPWLILTLILLTLGLGALAIGVGASMEEARY